MLCASFKYVSFLISFPKVESAERGNSLASVHLRHYALVRNRRNLLAYVWNRLERVKNLRWDFGSILPPDVKGEHFPPGFGSDERLPEAR